MKPLCPALCLALLASCRSEVPAHDPQASKGEEITFIVLGPVHPGELKGDHFFQFVVREGNHADRAIGIPMQDGSTTDAVCGMVAAGIEDIGGPPLEMQSSNLATSHGTETAASFVLPPPWHLVSVTVERRDRDDGRRVLDMSEVEVWRDGRALPNTEPPAKANTATSAK